MKNISFLAIIAGSLWQKQTKKHPLKTNKIRFVIKYRRTQKWQ